MHWTSNTHSSTMFWHQIASTNMHSTCVLGFALNPQNGTESEDGDHGASSSSSSQLDRITKNCTNHNINPHHSDPSAYPRFEKKDWEGASLLKCHCSLRAPKLTMHLQSNPPQPLTNLNGVYFFSVIQKKNCNHHICTQRSLNFNQGLLKQPIFHRFRPSPDEFFQTLNSLESSSLEYNTP